MSEPAGSAPHPARTAPSRRHAERARVQALVAAAVLAYLDGETPSAQHASQWARAARVDGLAAGGPWPAGLLTWQEAERPR